MFRPYIPVAAFPKFLHNLDLGIRFANRRHGVI
jgi:hypothetical protein